MPDITEKYNLNHTYYPHESSLEIPIGDSTQNQLVHLKLFERSLALTSDLKRLPILRGAKIIVGMHANVMSRLFGSGLVGAKVDVFLVNKKMEDADEEMDFDQILASAKGFFFVDTTNNSVAVEIQQDSWDFEGGILLSPTITLIMKINLNGVVATTALVAGTWDYSCHMEVDWAEVSKKEFQEFILENVYAKMEDE